MVEFSFSWDKVLIFCLLFFVGSILVILFFFGYDAFNVNDSELILKNIAEEHCNNLGMVLYNYEEAICPYSFYCVDDRRFKKNFFFSNEEQDACR